MLFHLSQILNLIFCFFFFFFLFEEIENGIFIFLLNMSLNLFDAKYKYEYFDSRIDLIQIKNEIFPFSRNKKKIVQDLTTE